MRSTLYFKSVLLFTALFLGVIAYQTSFRTENAFAQNVSKLNTQVLCSSCGIPGKKMVAHVIILDQNTGKIWAYEDVVGAPVYLGTMSEVGKPIQIQK